MNKLSILLSLFLMTQYSYSETLTERELQCLYKNAYFEGNNDSVIAQQGIIEVVLNRKKEKPNSDVCSVIYAKNAFSWTTKRHTIPKSQRHVFKLTKLVVDVIVQGIQDGSLKPLTYGATYYHADYVNPCWLSDMSFVNKLGKHLFYKQVSNDSQACYKRTRKTMIASYSRSTDPVLVNVERNIICQYCDIQNVSFVDLFDVDSYSNKQQSSNVVAMLD
jgi:N-acetylmuramoyl-L-alanine amidase